VILIHNTSGIWFHMLTTDMVQRMLLFSFLIVVYVSKQAWGLELDSLVYTDVVHHHLFGNVNLCKIQLLL
jgi:hypothetical protein